MVRPKDKARNGKTSGAQPTSRQPCKEKTSSVQKPSHSAETFHLLDLALEIRVMIYTHALSTKDNDGKTNIYEIHEHSGRKLRRNNFRPNNFGWNHTAMLAVNRQIREEVQTYCDLNMAFKFCSTVAFSKFIWDGSCKYPKLSKLKVNMLHAATKIEVVIGGREQSKWKNYRPVESLQDVVDGLSVPLTVEFVAKQSINQVTNKRCIRFFNEVVNAWKDWMEHAGWLDRSPRVA